MVVNCCWGRSKSTFCIFEIHGRATEENLCMMEQWPRVTSIHTIQEMIYLSEEQSRRKWWNSKGCRCVDEDARHARIGHSDPHKGRQCNEPLCSSCEYFAIRPMTVITTRRKRDENVRSKKENERAHCIRHQLLDFVRYPSYAHTA